MLFMQGQRDCEQGKPADENKPEAYQRGYGAQYELEQVMDALTQ